MSFIAASARCLRMVARPGLAAQTQTRSFVDNVALKRWAFKYGI